ncbi:ABC transporter permease [Patescibacteria group bacterium]|nr:ABC transporter permease [Patescibacteria group bacterium]
MPKMVREVAMAVALVYHRNASKMKNLAYTIRLSLALAKANFKLRNEGTYLGILWYLLNPLLLFALLFLIFFDRLGQNIEQYPLYLLLGIIMFNFFQQATTEATKIIDQNRHLIKSINFPKESLIASIISTTFSRGFVE